MIDSHCHLDHENLYNTIDEVIDRSKNAGITKLLTICTTIKSFDKIIKIINLDPMIFGTFGIHPHESETDIVTKDIILKKIKNNKKIIGVGETGLDFYYNHSDKKVQISSFISHIEAALELNLPLIVHSRNAEKETYDILESHKSKNLKILMHCFTGSTNFARKLQTLNSYFSASGIITFNNSVDLQNTFKNLPMDNLLVETDSPYLAPVPMRGKKNEPSFIRYTIEKLSNLKSLSPSEISKITTDNFDKLFF
jgi:TatD DNase family protein